MISLLLNLVLNRSYLMLVYASPRSYGQNLDPMIMLPYMYVPSLRTQHMCAHTFIYHRLVNTVRAAGAIST